jgi:hypothetical protein
MRIHTTAPGNDAPSRSVSIEWELRFQRTLELPKPFQGVARLFRVLSHAPALTMGHRNYG